MRRVNVGGRAGEHHTVNHGQKFGHLLGTGQGKHDGLGIRTDFDGAGVFVTQDQSRHLMPRVAQQAVIGG